MSSKMPVEHSDAEILSGTPVFVGTRVPVPSLFEHARKIQVKNGRLVLDEATNLPDGADVEILVIDDELTSEERADLHASLDGAQEDSDAGQGMEAWDCLQRYRAQRGDLVPGLAGRFRSYW